PPPPPLPSFPTRRSSDLRLGRRARRHPSKPRNLVPTSARGARQACPARMAAGAHLRNTQGGSVIRIKRAHVLVAAVAVALCVPRSEEHTSELQSRSDLVC